ncbi:unnamed protein product [Closterium sp. Naga37s-1]|nr:unnamed protein product [Closterium sp. Naga37s-1]
MGPLYNHITTQQPPLEEWRSFVHCTHMLGLELGKQDHFKGQEGEGADGRGMEVGGEGLRAVVLVCVHCTHMLGRELGKQDHFKGQEELGKQDHFKGQEGEEKTGGGKRWQGGGEGLRGLALVCAVEWTHLLGKQDHFKGQEGNQKGKGERGGESGACVCLLDAHGGAAGPL